jgi:hypothetical protein
MAHSDENINSPLGYYKRGKTAIFAMLYGAQPEKLAKALKLSVAETKAGLERFLKKYPGIRKAQQLVTDSLTALVQPEAHGPIIWKEPQEYVSSFMGFRRYFTLEYSIIRALYAMANNPSDNLQSLGLGTKVVRRDRVQSAFGATVSAIYALAFNLQSQILRAGVNHRIQSPGGQSTKELEYEIWCVQPRGIHEWLVQPLNIHDEIQCPCHPSVVDRVTDVVNAKVSQLQRLIPMVSMKWKTNLKNWGEK